LTHEQIRRVFNIDTIGHGIEDYLAQRPEHRIEWAHNTLARIRQDKKMELGAQVEASWYLMNRLYEAEPLEKIQKALKPLVDQVDEDMSEMIKTLSQENPAD